MYASSSQTSKGGSEKQSPVLLRARGADERANLLRRKRVDVIGHADARSLDVGHRVARQAPDPHRTFEDAVQHHEPLLNQRSHSAAASATVAPVSTIPAGSPRRACASSSSSHACALRFVNQPAAGRPAAGPRRPDPALDLAPVGKPVFGVPLRPAPTLDAGDVAGDRLQRPRLQSQTERRRNRTFQPPGCDGLPVLKAPDPR